MDDEGGRGLIAGIAGGKSAGAAGAGSSRSAAVWWFAGSS